GAAVFGSVMTNRFAQVLGATLPVTVRAAVPPERLAVFFNPQALLNPDAETRLREAFAPLGAQGPALLAAFVEAIRGALAAALAEVFLGGAILVGVALLATIFIPEIPLRKRPQRADAPAEPDGPSAATEPAPGAVAVAGPEQARGAGRRRRRWGRS